MNRIILLITALFMFVSTPISRVLIVVDEGYFDHDMQLPPPEGYKIVRYREDLMNKQSIYAYILIFETGKDCFDLWYTLSNLYEQYHSNPDPIEGVVLVGDLPVPTFHYGVRTIPCEYFYMDLWDNDPTTNAPYPDWEKPNGPWERWSGDILDRAFYAGDGELEIWVSRIYATNLLHLRSAGAAWGDFLEEYEIIDAYLDKVHERMNTPVSFRRGVAMGYPPGVSSFRTLQVMSAMDNLGLGELHYMDDMTDLKLNQAAAWQAVLQSGRSGNINWGAYHGNRYTNTTYKRDCRTGLSSRYYEWAAFFAHSSPQGSYFHQYPAGGAYQVGRAFLNVNNTEEWTLKNSGGCNGKYYEWNRPHDGNALAEWSCVVPSRMGGQYAVYMYWNVISWPNSSTSYFNCFGNKNFSKVAEGHLDQLYTSSDKWNYLAEFTAEAFDTLVLRMHPNVNGFTRFFRCVADAVEFRLLKANPWDPNFIYYSTGSFVSYGGINYKCIQAHTSQRWWRPPYVPALWQQADFKIRVTPGNLAQPWDPNGVYYPFGSFVSCDYINYRCQIAHTSQTAWEPPIVPALWQQDNTSAITPNDLFDISNRGANGFRLTNWYNRSFCDMQDDGGQSKVLFFEGVACEISNYLVDDNLGLLYGMGHAGLTMIGNSYPNYGGNDFGVYTDRMGSTSPVYSFGEAYLDYANRDFPAANDNFIMFGAGTLKAFSY